MRERRGGRAGVAKHQHHTHTREHSTELVRAKNCGGGRIMHARRARAPAEKTRTRRLRRAVCDAPNTVPVPGLSAVARRAVQVACVRVGRGRALKNQGGSRPKARERAQKQQSKRPASGAAAVAVCARALGQASGRWNMLHSLQNAQISPPWPVTGLPAAA